MDDVRLALELELTRQFIIYQWRIDNPWPQPDETFEDMRLKYSALLSGLALCINKSSRCSKKYPMYSITTCILIDF